MKGLFFTLACCCFSILSYAQTDSVFVFDSTSRFTEQEQHLNFLFDKYSESLSKSDTLITNQLFNQIRSTFDSFDESAKSDYCDKIKEDLVTTFETNDNDIFLRKSEKALFFLPNEDDSRFDILSTVADIYAGRNNKEMLDETLALMEEMPVAANGENAETITRLKTVSSTLAPLEQVFSGFWLSNQHMTKSGCPYLVVEFNNYNGVSAYITPMSGIRSGTLIDDNVLLRKSNVYSCDYKRQVFKFDFYNNNVQKGNLFLSDTYNSLAKSTRQTASEVLHNKNVSLGKGIATSFLGNIAAGLLEMEAEEVAQSEVTDEVIILSGSIVSQDVISSNLLYQQQMVNTIFMTPFTTALDNYDQKLYRWRPEDNIVFGDMECKPVSPWVKKLDKDSELFRISKEYSFWSKPKYWGLSILAVYVGTGLLIGGVAYMCNKKTLAGAALAATGLTLAVAIPVELTKSRKAKRLKAIYEYNIAQYRKLTQ